MAQIRDIEKILFITLSNLGDAMMALPAFDFLRSSFPEAHITVVCAPNTSCVFENHPQVQELIVFDKHSSLKNKIALFFHLKAQDFDCIVDLKNTFYRWALPAKFKNSIRRKYPGWITHSSQQHLYATVCAVRKEKITKEEFFSLSVQRDHSFVSSSDRNYVRHLLESVSIKDGEDFILFSPGARSELKKWGKDKFSELAAAIWKDLHIRVVVVGQEREKDLAEYVAGESKEGIIVFTGQTNFRQLCALIMRSRLVIGNDSGVMHISSYLNTPTIGIFGPSDSKMYGPWSSCSSAVVKQMDCVPCLSSVCKKNRECMESLEYSEVFDAVKDILKTADAVVAQRSPAVDFERILIVRTDRMGDVLLSTPVIKSIRRRFPSSFIAVMVKKSNKDLVEGNPYLDEVITFDKDGSDDGMFGTLKFSRRLKSFKFDIAVILHPTFRVHFVCFLAGIKKRLGYDNRAPYFLNMAVPHEKQYGRMHEMEYNFKLIERMGITVFHRELYMPIKGSSEVEVRSMLVGCGIAPAEKIVVLHPAASCISKRWSIKRFAQVADRLNAFTGVKIVVVADTVYSEICSQLCSLSKVKPVNLCGKLNLSQLASLLKRSSLLISNDSGPVHMSVAVGTPVISIFARAQAGLSPLRWGPLGKKDVILHKDMDCRPCLAHDCTKNFKCLEAITVDEVFTHACGILKQAA